MKNTYFFKGIDRSESLEGFIDKKMNNFRFPLPNSRWVISKENEKFIVQCILKGSKHYESSHKDPYKAVKQILESIKSHHYRLWAS